MRTSILHRTDLVGSPAMAGTRVPDGLDTLRRFLDVAVAATGRASFYNTSDEQQQAEAAAHQEMLAVDRGVYAALVAAPGVTDRTCQLGVRALLSHPRQPPAATLFDQAEETALLELAAACVDRLGPQPLTAAPDRRPAVGGLLVETVCGGPFAGQVVRDGGRVVYASLVARVHPDRLGRLADGEGSWLVAVQGRSMRVHR